MQGAPSTLDRSQRGPVVVADGERRRPLTLRTCTPIRHGCGHRRSTAPAMTFLCALCKVAGDIHRLGAEPPDHFPRDVFDIIIRHHKAPKKTGAFIGAEVWGNCYRYVESGR